MSGTRWPAPAKINLFLHVTGRRENGYHNLQTAFQFLDVRDQLDFRFRDDEQIIRHGNYLGVDNGDDLVVRAAHLLRAHCQADFGVDIHVDKHLPMGGGLGGGSSNAATTLVALNALLGLDLPVEEVAALGLQLGADVPVFVHGHAAFAEGVGEVLTPITPAEKWYLVVVPEQHVSTAEIFNDRDLTRNTTAITIRDFLTGVGHNDCEEVVCRRYPEIAGIMDWLATRYNARMTGTGACVYASFDYGEQAREAAKSLPAAWRHFIARGLNYSPLQQRLARETESGN